MSEDPVYVQLRWKGDQKDKMRSGFVHQPNDPWFSHIMKDMV